MLNKQGTFGSGRSAGKSIYVGMKRDDALRGVTVKFGREDQERVQAEIALSKNRRKVSQNALDQILKIQTTTRRSAQ